MGFVLLCSNRSDFLWPSKRSIFLLGLVPVIGVVVFMLGSVEFSSPLPEPPRSAPAGHMLKLLPEERLKDFFTFDGIW